MRQLFAIGYKMRRDLSKHDTAPPRENTDRSENFILLRSLKIYLRLRACRFPAYRSQCYTVSFCEAPEAKRSALRGTRQKILVQGKAKIGLHSKAVVACVSFLIVPDDSRMLVSFVERGSFR